MSDVDVAVVGGGAAGAAVALSLGRLGMTCEVFERLPTVSSIDRGDVIHAGTIDLLRRWGVWDDILEAGGLQFPRFEILRADGAQLLTADLTADVGPGTHFTSLRHPETVRILTHAAAATGCATSHNRQAVTDLLVEGDRVAGVVTSAGTCRALLTVVAGGSRSALRDTYLGRPRIVEYPYAFLNTVAPLQESFARRGAYILGDGGLMVVAPLPGGLMRVGFQVPRHSGETLTSTGLSERAAGLYAPFAHERLQLADLHSFPLRTALARRSVVPGCVVVGDAAHTTHPAGGQGMNLAFQDADLLGRALSEAPSHSADSVDLALLRYQRERKRAVRSVVLRCHVMGVMAGWNQKRRAAVRRALVTVGGRVPPLRRSLVRRIVEVR